MSPLTVPMTMLPMGSAPVSASSGRSIAMPAFMALAASSTSRNEEDAVAEVDPDDAHPFDQGVVEDFVGGPASVQQNAGALVDLLVEPVVEVVVHLSGQVFVAQRVEVDLVVVFAGRSRSRGTCWRVFAGFGRVRGGWTRVGGGRVVGHSDGS